MNMAEQILEFDKIKELWKRQALTRGAKERIEAITPYMEEVKLSLMLKETTEAKILIEKQGVPPLVSLEQFGEWLKAAGRGECLSAEELEGVSMTLGAILRLKKYLTQGKVWNLSLAYYEENLEPLEDLREEINVQIRNGQVDDYASRLLKSYRSDLEREEESMRQKAENALRGNQAYLTDHFTTIRNGRLCIPVKKEYKGRIQGHVIDQSATGTTVFIEPAAVARHYEAIQVLKVCEENEVRRILYELTSRLYDFGEVLEENIRVMEKLDFAFSKGKLSLEYAGVQPRINVERRIFLRDGRHPLMDARVCVPLQFEIGDDVRGIVITGPNTGGKTVAIKTVALNCMMAQCGLHVACSEADICMNSNFLCDIGDGQNLSANLSTFSAHIANVLDILSKANGNSLVIMDELGSGTDPTEGMGIAIAILEELHRSGALFLVTTHYPEVKHYAEDKEGVVNARMTFDRESLKPLYQLVIGEAGESCAFYIAGRMGMPESMLATAVRAAYGEELPDTLKELVRENVINKEGTVRIQRKKESKGNRKKGVIAYHLGDSVMIYPDRKIGIVCVTPNEKGVLRVQMPGKKIWINHKRVKLHVAAKELYPEDYDFSIIFDTVENRKLRHRMDRGVEIEDAIVYENEMAENN